MKILISGGSGLVGQVLSQLLLKKNYEVAWLSRKAGHNKLGIKEHAWNVESGEIDPKALENTEAIINLAGAPISDRWTPQHKSAVLRSRVDGTRLLFNSVQKHKTPLKAFISASAVGYYPNSFTQVFTEDDPPGSDFLSLVCQKWEQEAQNFEELNIRTVILRVGIVLSAKGGALPKIAAPIKLWAGAPLASGKQVMPWIHITDLAQQFVFALENENMQGAYNACGPSNATNAAFTKAVAKILNKPLILPKVPAFALKLLLGEMAETVLASNPCSNKKITATGFTYQYPQLPAALANIYNN
jgi:uncharacterized protein (TIGR01777 family)